MFAVAAAYLNTNVGFSPTASHKLRFNSWTSLKLMPVVKLCTRWHNKQEEGMADSRVQFLRIRGQMLVDYRLGSLAVI